MKKSSYRFMIRSLGALSIFALFVSTSFAITLTQLQNDINSVVNNSNSSVQWSIKIENNAGDGDFYSKNPTTMRRPASNTKIFTTAAAFRKYGANHVWNGYSLGSSSTASPVHKILSNSDNGLADSLWSHVGGESAVIAQLAGITSTAGMQVDDGSGLDYDNRFNCEQTIDVVRYMRNTYTYNQWGSHLAISCTSGTLGSRICGTGKTGRVHAKTGTLTNGQTLSLSGYVDNQYDGKRYYFSIYCNSVPSSAQSDTRSRIDTIVGYMCQSGLPNVDPAPTEVIVDNSSSAFSASSSWWTSSSTPGYYGSNYHVRAVQSISDAATWKGNIPSSGTYQVYARWSAGSNRSSSAPYIVYHNGGSTTINKNQQTGGGAWNLLGTFSLNSGSTADRVKLSCWTSAQTYVIGDAIRFVKQ